MITEQQMKVLFAQANPIPDASTVPLDEVAAATYLATLETRSSEMTTTETNPVETDKKPDRNWKPLLVAAAAILIAGLAWMVANRGDEVPPATQPPDSVSTELQGTWGAGSLRVTFEGDEYAIVRLDFQPEQPWDRGTYTSDESSVSFTTSSSVVCAPGETGLYGLEFLGFNRIVLTFEDDPCGSVRGFGFDTTSLTKRGD